LFLAFLVQALRAASFRMSVKASQLKTSSISHASSPMRLPPPTVDATMLERLERP
jgi:hypothetical protein